MTSHTIPVTQPRAQHNPHVNSVCDISGRNRRIEGVFNDRLKLHERQYKLSK